MRNPVQVLLLLFAISACTGAGDIMLSDVPVWAGDGPALIAVTTNSVTVGYGLEKEADVRLVATTNLADDARVMLGGRTTVRRYQTADGVASFTISNLPPDTAVRVVLCAADLRGNAQRVPVVLETRTVGLAPAWAAGYPKLVSCSDTNAVFAVKIGSWGRAYCAVRAGDVARPTPSGVRAGDRAGGCALAPGEERLLKINGLRANAGYVAWIVSGDMATNVSIEPVGIPLTTNPQMPQWVAQWPQVGAVGYNSAAAGIKLDGYGRVHCIARPVGAIAPDAAAIKSGDASGGTVLASGLAKTVTKTGLLSDTGYRLWFVQEATDGRLGVPVSLTIRTRNLVPPVWMSGVPRNDLMTISAARFTVGINENGHVYCLRLAAGSAAPTPAVVKSGAQLTTRIWSGATEIVDLVGLANNTGYDFWFVADDDDGNLQTVPACIYGKTLDGVAPVWTAGWPQAGTAAAHSLSLKVKSGENGKVYVAARAAGSPTPTAAQVKAAPSASCAVVANSEITIVVSGLDEKSTYDLWAVAEDASANLQGYAVKVAMKTLDETPPVWVGGYPKVVSTTATSVVVRVMLNETGTVYALVTDAGSGVAPGSAAVKASPASMLSIGSGTGGSLLLNGLSRARLYDVWLVAEDASGNLQSLPTLVSVVTKDELLDMVDVPAGSELNIGNSSFTDASPAHPVAAISAFSIGKYEITYGLWTNVRSWAVKNGYVFKNPGVMGSNTVVKTPQDPVIVICHNDAIAWCNALSEYSKMTPVYYTEPTKGVVYRNATDAWSTLVRIDKVGANDCVLWAGTGYRLPTEAEWEYAARWRFGGMLSDSDKPAGYFGLLLPDATGTAEEWGRYAWYGGNGYLPMYSVGQKLPNDLGLYDMSGNARELCWDWYGTYSLLDVYTSANPRGLSFGKFRSIRSGNYVGSEGNGLRALRTSYRMHNSPHSVYISCTGFRIVRSQQ